MIVRSGPSVHGGTLAVLQFTEADNALMKEGWHVEQSVEGDELRIQLVPPSGQWFMFDGRQPSSLDSPAMNPQAMRYKAADAIQDKLSASMMGGFEDFPSADEVKPDAVTGGQS